VELLAELVSDSVVSLSDLRFRDAVLLDARLLSPVELTDLERDARRRLLRDCRGRVPLVD